MYFSIYKILILYLSWVNLPISIILCYDFNPEIFGLGILNPNIGNRYYLLHIFGLGIPNPNVLGFKT